MRNTRAGESLELYEIEDWNAHRRRHQHEQDIAPREEKWLPSPFADDDSEQGQRSQHEAKQQ
jgi:hypothetical protein